MINLKQGIKSGLNAVHGSDESRGKARHLAFGLQRRLAVANFFVTISPATDSTYVISINSGTLKEEDVITINFLLPNRTELRCVANQNPYQMAVYAKRVFDVFIQHFLGWDFEFRRPRKEGGALGYLRWLMGSAESQMCTDNHGHFVGAIYGFPRTSKQLTQDLLSPELRRRSVTITFIRCAITTFNLNLHFVLL